MLLLVPALTWGWPQVEPPPQAQVSWVAENMRYNGVPMRIQQFESTSSAEAVLEFYRARWLPAGAQDPTQPLGPYRVLARPEGGYLLSVQVRPNGAGSTGYLTVTHIAARRAAPLGEGFPHPPGSRVINDIQSEDGGRRGRTLLLHNGHSLRTNTAFYGDRLPAQGWGLIAQRGEGGGEVLLFRRGEARLNLVITPSAEGTAVAAQID